MIRLGDRWWLDASASGWMLLEVRGDGRARETRRHGPYTSPRHVLQQRVVKLPKLVMRELTELAAVMEAGDEAVGGMPSIE